MTADPNLYALVIGLRPTRPAPLPEVRGDGAQALFLELVRRSDAALAERLHADAPCKPLTVAALPRPDRAREPLVELRFTLAAADLFQPITQALLRQMDSPPLRIGGAALALADVCGTPESHRWAGFTSFESLRATVRPTRMLTLEFATPTAFGQGSRADGRARLGLLPLPETIFKSIGQRWNDLTPQLAIDPEQIRRAAGDTLISRYDLETRQISLGKGPQKGFVGRCTYELPDDPALASTLTLLADAVFYLGVGVKTARGMGLCRRIAHQEPE